MSAGIAFKGGKRGPVSDMRRMIRASAALRKTAPADAPLPDFKSEKPGAQDGEAA